MNGMQGFKGHWDKDTIRERERENGGKSFKIENVK